MAQSRSTTSQLSMIWSAMVSSVVLYVFVAVALFRDGSPADPDPTLRLVLSSAAAVAALASFWWRRTQVAGFGGGPTAPARTAQAGEPPDVVRLTTACVVAWALSESVAIFGLVLAFLGRNALEAVPFAVASLGLFVLHRPAVWLPSEAGREISKRF